MRTALTLTEDQISRMLHFAQEQIGAIETGRVDWIRNQERYLNEYNGSFEHRMAESAIFGKSNETLNIITGGIDYITARRVESIFKIEPWVGVSPRTKTGQSPQFADQLTRHLTWKLGPEQIDFQAHAEEVLKIVGILGQCVSKVVHVAETEDYEKISSILVDKKTGKEVVDQTGEFIFQENGVEQGQAEDGQPYQFPTGHPEIPLTEQYDWQEKIVTEKSVKYIGAKSIPLHFKEFYCPLEAKSIQESHFVAHMTTMRLSALLKQLDVDIDDKEPDSDEDDKKQKLPENLKKLIDAVKNENGKSKAEGDKPINSQGEGESPQPNDADPQFRYCEAYMRFDARDDGRAFTIFFCFAPDHDIPIFWEYLANVTPDGKYPFNAVVQDKVPLRWYGTSWYKKYQCEQSLIDRLLNQVIYRNNIAANPTKFRKKEAVVQWQDDQPIESSPDKVYDLNDGFTAKDALQIQEIPDLDQRTKELLDMSIAAWRTRSGISTATDSELANVPQQKTATGVTAIVNSGNTLFTPLVLDVARGLEAELRMIVKYQYVNQSEEQFTYQQNNQTLVDILTPDMVKGLDMFVELKLTNLSATQRLEQSAAAGQVITEFLSLPLFAQPIVIPIYGQRLQALEMDNGEDLLKQLIQAEAQQSAPSPQQKISETIAFKDLGAFPEAQVRALQSIGWLTDQEGAAHIQKTQNESLGAQAGDTRQAAIPQENPQGGEGSPGSNPPTET